MTVDKRRYSIEVCEGDHIQHLHTIKTPIGKQAILQTENRVAKTTRLSVEGPIECPFTGFQLLNSSLFNKGSAFTDEEREAFDLVGLLPPQVNTLDEQVERAYNQLCYLKTPLLKNDFCVSMRVQNKVLYYELVKRHIRELLPIIYTPTEGDAIAAYSDRFRKPEGCFLDITSPETIESRLAKFGEDKDIDYMVISDGEGILGIGDQGVGGIRIAIAKLGLMTLCGGIHPGRVIPVCIDAGTNNERLLNDELYMGNKFPRISGKQYDDFVASFMKVVKEKYPSSIVHFEDFGVSNARKILKQYRDYLPCFNDDIQGTGAVVMASMTAALKITNRDLLDSQIVIYGAGSAGLGIADQIVKHMISHGSTEEAARERIHVLDRYGLITKSMTDTSSPDQLLYADEDSLWEGVNKKSLLEVVRKIKPTCLVGCSTQAGAFTEDIVKEMYKNNSRPIIFPLSNPTRLHEAIPEDLMKWTDNNALIATGSPFKPVDGHVISENNNCFTFPGIGLGSLLSRASVISDSMISACVDHLASLSPAFENPTAGLLPRLEDINEVSAQVATLMILQALNEGVARVENEKVDGVPVKVPRDFEGCLKWVKSQMWKPEYRPMMKVEHVPEIHTFQT